MPARRPDALGALQITVHRDRQGSRLQRVMVNAMRANAAAHGFRAVIACVRPTDKARYPLIPIEAYASWTRDDGLPFDPWIRLHVRLGGRLARRHRASMRIEGTVADWREWTGLDFPGPASTCPTGAAAPVAIDLAADGASTSTRTCGWCTRFVTGRRRAPRLGRPRRSPAPPRERPVEDLAVDHVDGAPGPCREVRVVGDHHDRPALVHEPLEQRRTPPRPSASPGCRSARRRRSAAGRWRARARSRRAAAGRRTAPTGSLSAWSAMPTRSSSCSARVRRSRGGQCRRSPSAASRSRRPSASAAAGRTGRRRRRVRPRHCGEPALGQRLERRAADDHLAGASAGRCR